MNSRWLIVTAAAFWLGGSTIVPAAGSAAAATSQTQPRSRPQRQAPSVARPGIGVIASRRTHLYFRPGSTAPLPSGSDRIYFRSEAQARAAGYRLAPSRPIVYPSLPPMKSQRHSPASPLSREQPDTAPTQPTVNP